MGGIIKNFRQKTKPLMFTRIENLMIKDNIVQRALYEEDVADAETKIYRMLYRVTRVIQTVF